MMTMMTISKRLWEPMSQHPPIVAISTFARTRFNAGDMLTVTRATKARQYN